MQVYDAIEPYLGHVRGREPGCNLAEYFIVTSVRIIKARCIYEVDGDSRAYLAGVDIHNGCALRNISAS